MGKSADPKDGPDTRRRLQDVLRFTTVGGRLRSMARCETFFVVGDLDHTFALKPAHTRKRVGNHRYSQPRRLTSGRVRTFLSKRSYTYPHCSSRGRFAANGLRTPATSSRCLPRSDLKRTLCERCERYSERLRTLTWNVSHCWGQTTTAAVGPAARNPYGFDLSYTTAAVFRGQRSSSPYLIPPDHPLIHRWIEAMFLEFDGGAIRGGVVPRY